MKLTTLTHQQSNANLATSHVANLRMQTGPNLAMSHVATSTAQLNVVSAARLNASVAARLNVSVVTLLNANPTSPSKETAKEENR